MLNLTVYDNNIIKPIDFEVYNDSNDILVYSGSSYSTPVSLDIGRYYLKILTNGVYNINNIMIITDNYITNNVNTTTNVDTIRNIDIGVVQTEIISNITPIGLPILDYIIINNGVEQISSSILNIDISFIGVAYEYMLSYNPTFTGGVWNTITSNTIIHDYGDYLTDTTVDIYLKVRNTIGESDIRHDSISLINGIYRSDNLKTYNSLKTCLTEIDNDYPSGLTQDVNIILTSQVDEKVKSGIFLVELEDFNKNTNYFLTISGNSLLNIDCSTAGGIKMNSCDNIIIRGINFTNVSNLANSSSPEQLAAIFVRGTSEEKIENLIIQDCTINGIYIDQSNITHYGTYGIVCSNIKNLTILNVEISNMGLICIDADKLDAITLSNINIYNCNVIRGLVSQPCLIQAKTTSLLYIEDTVIDGTNHDTGIIITNVNNIILKRNIFKNLNGEALRISSSIEIKNIIVESCLFHDILMNPYYYWTKQHIGITGTLDNLFIINNTIILNEINYSDSYTRFIYFSDIINNVKFFNNIIDFRFLNKFENKAQATIFLGNTISNMESDYNVYRDYTSDNNIISNMFFNIDNTSPLDLERINNFSDLKELGLDTHSTLYNITYGLFVNDFYTIDTNTTNLNINLDYKSKYDINKNLSDTPNVGSYFQTTISASTVEQNTIYYYGIDVSENKIFYTGSTENIYSNSNIILISENIEKNKYYKWTFENTEVEQIITYGIGIQITLISKNDEFGNYISDELYSIEIEKIT